MLYIKSVKFTPVFSFQVVKILVFEIRIKWNLLICPNQDSSLIKNYTFALMEREENQFSGGRRYRNDDITVYWKPSACIHASYCYRELIEVFDPSRRPWVDLNGATTDNIIEVVNLCPTEALAWKWNDDEKNASVRSDQLNHIMFRRPELMNTIDPVNEEHPVSVKIMVDGPIVLKGNFTLSYDGNTKEVNDNLISICRCGISDHMPFCDGQHRKVGFNG